MATRKKPPNGSDDGEKPRRRKRASEGNGEGQLPLFSEEAAPLHDLARTRYLNYALSVITSRALPDVRDGLKPVQRRILYTMWQQGVGPTDKHRKCAKIVGDVMGSYHPHGDSAIYDALVRMAQSFSMRGTLVDGSGNFGSLDGDPAAAYRYTECRLAPLATRLLDELDQDTVHFRPNYDGTKTEPVVLPAQLPNLLVNGTTGIAVGMATNIPPHNPEEVCAAALRLLDALDSDKQLSSRELTRTLKGPDFPTGGQIVSSSEELKEVYDTGQGAIRVRGTWRPGREGRSTKFVEITSIPYAVNKATLVERIAEIAVSRKLPMLLDVRDVSTETVSIELELKKDADERKVLAYLFKNTPLQSSFFANFTCLVPTENPEVGRPERIDLKQILWHFLHFRLDVVTRRLEHELGVLERRIHVLAGFEKVFDALDTILKIIRKSDGKADAAKTIMARFELDAEQTDAILELKLYRIARLEILVIQKELKEKRKRAKEIKTLLAESGQKGRWALVRSDLEAVAAALGKDAKRRTLIAGAEGETEFSEDELIVAEDAVVILTTDGWIKRQKEIKDTASTRLREGDRVFACEVGSTKASIVFLSNFGTAYTARILDVPATTGYGEPIQKLFKLKDGERIVAAFSLDPRVTGELGETDEKRGKTYAVAATSDGYALTFGLAPFAEPSTRAGRRFARPADDAEVIGVERVNGGETLIAASKQRRALLCNVDEVNFLGGPGKGVILVKLEDDDTLLGIKASRGPRDVLVVETSMGGEQRIGPATYERTSRGGRGREIMKRGNLARVVVEPPEAPPNLGEGAS
ncbi:MAG TPA: DNA topoisomerase (ATP-hydrolyzing) [Polyangiaceae bacterium]